MRRIILAICVLVSGLLWGCATPHPVAPAAISAQTQVSGLERVLGSTADNLITAFGNPDQDLREPDARRLQFEGSICILDAYLYRLAETGEPRVTSSPISMHVIRTGAILIGPHASWPSYGAGPL
jgi:hypothetical protein